MTLDPAALLAANEAGTSVSALARMHNQSWSRMNALIGRAVQVKPDVRPPIPGQCFNCTCLSRSWDFTTDLHGNTVRIAGTCRIDTVSREPDILQRTPTEGE